MLLDTNDNQLPLAHPDNLQYVTFAISPAITTFETINQPSYSWQMVTLYVRAQMLTETQVCARSPIEQFAFFPTMMMMVILMMMPMMMMIIMTLAGGLPPSAWQTSEMFVLSKTWKYFFFSSLQYYTIFLQKNKYAIDNFEWEILDKNTKRWSQKSLPRFFRFSPD